MTTKTTTVTKKENSDSKKNKKSVNKTGPKRPLTAYMHYSQERRKSLIEENPQLKSHVTEISKIIGAEWKKFDDLQKEKYNKLANEDKNRYNIEINNLKAK